MERRERYDPEDIENLLTERSFDELLEEERAFVLRHMSGREEYDRMRALLHYTRPDERSHATIEPEDRVRANVMNAFRAQRTPPWRVWLNSVMAWFAPSETSDLWRPALAFGTLALLVVAGVFTVQYLGGPERGGLAEVRKVERPSSKTTPAPTVAPGEKASGTSSSSDLVPTSDGAVEAESVDVPDLKADQRTANTNERSKDMALDEVRAASEREISDAAFEHGTSELEMDLAFEEMEEKEGTISTGHIVTQEELLTNQSLANTDISAAKKATGTARTKVSRATDATMMTSRRLGQDPQLLGLVTAGW